MGERQCSGLNGSMSVGCVRGLEGFDWPLAIRIFTSRQFVLHYITSKHGMECQLCIYVFSILFSTSEWNFFHCLVAKLQDVFLVNPNFVSSFEDMRHHGKKKKSCSVNGALRAIWY